MERYINADKLIKKIFPLGLVDDGKYTINAKAVKMAIDKAPTADVVPKSEVEKIFEEIEAMTLDFSSGIRKSDGKFIEFRSVDNDRFAELKKKYTESEDTK
ncbi:MAG: hypothetical protein IJZ42_01425 [Lachnospiraceae bacterium]|nr:hypothetical protein [Lachnospiraceae bacterium]